MRTVDTRLFDLENAVLLYMKEKPVTVTGYILRGKEGALIYKLLGLICTADKDVGIQFDNGTLSYEKQRVTLEN